MHAQGCRGRGDHGVAFLPFLILQRELLALKWILSPLEASVCVMGSGVWRQRWDPKSKFKLLHRCFLATWSSWRALPLTSVGGTCPLPPTILLPRLLSLAGTFLTLTPVVPSLPSHQATQGCWPAGGSGSIWRLHTPPWGLPDLPPVWSIYTIFISCSYCGRTIN